MTPSEKSKRQHDHKKTFQVIKWIFVVMVLSLVVWMGKIMVKDQPSIKANEYNPANQTVEAQVTRGSILGRNGEELAYTETEEDGTERRVYPYGECLAHVVGYTGRGNAGLEAVENTTLTTAPSLLNQLESWANDTKVQGQSIKTTIDPDLQQYCYSLLGGYQGAVVITDPTTGQTLAEVSAPSFDPSMLVDNWESISERSDSPLYARATQGLYAPGSTFKIVTALAMYRNMPDYQDYYYTCNGVLELSNTTIACSGGEAHGTVGITDAFAYSCNGFFGSAGVKMGASALRQTADYLNVGNDFGYELPQSTSQVVVKDNDSEGMVAQTAIGQGETLMTPFALNQLTCAIANGGALYTPYLVDSVTDGNGAVVKQNLPKLWGTIMKPDEAAFEENLMAGVVQYGTAAYDGLASDSYTVYGKTGTAQVEGQEDNSWFTCYTKVDGQPDLAVTVLVENAGDQVRAASLTAQILSYYYSTH